MYRSTGRKRLLTFRILFLLLYSPSLRSGIQPGWKEARSMLLDQAQAPQGSRKPWKTVTGEEGKPQFLLIQWIKIFMEISVCFISEKCLNISCEILNLYNNTLVWKWWFSVFSLKWKFSRACFPTAHCFSFAAFVMFQSGIFWPAGVFSLYW